MSLASGTKLGPYEILAALGAGGMGEVYKARDTRLDRTVAVKVLPADLAADPDRRARFEREARAIAALSHPHICTVHDVGRHEEIDYLVMEYLEGETLADRLAHAKVPLPLAQGLTIGIALADALDKAHRAGIVHRDLKPANVMLTKSGVKLLDFGLAKLRGPAAPISMSGMTMATATATPATATGTILGTIHYMAPEQVEGREADTRSDIWALGAVIYEMATGRRPFDGASAAGVIGAILKDTPPAISVRRPLAPSALDHLVERCLEKDADERWQDARDVKRELNWIAECADATTSGAGAVVVTPRTGTRRAARRAIVALGILGVLAVGIAIGGRYLSNAAAPAATMRFEVQPPAEATLAPAPVASAAQLALSPDGRRLAFVAARKRTASQLWIRPLDGVDAQSLPGTEGASFPFWSPDSRFIAFFASGKLKKIDTTGGVPQVLCNAAAGRGGSWNLDGIIVFVGQTNSPMSRISASGGVVTAATKFDPDQAVTLQYWPQFLPDGRHFLYYQFGSKPEYRGVYVTALDSSSSTRILESDGMARYASGHLVFVRGGTLFAQAFDERALQTSGDPVRIGDQVGYSSPAFGYAAVTVSPVGVLAHGPHVGMTTSLRWHDRSRASTGAPFAPAQYSSPRLSPDQRSVVVAMTDAAMATPDLWVLGLARGTTSRLTSDPAADWFPVWSADGGRLLFVSSRSGANAIFQKAVGGGQEEPAAEGMVSAAAATFPSDMSGDGRFLLYAQATSRGYDLGVLTLAGARTSRTFLSTPFDEAQGRFSPNSRWVAYASNESGRFEVYVRPFPAADGQTQISIGGGMQPEWRRDGRELFYISTDGKLTAVPVTTDGATFSAGAPRALFDVEVPEAVAPYPTDYAVSADGQRFLVNTVVDQPTRPALTVILNWTSGLKK